MIAASSGSLNIVGKAAPALMDFTGSFGAFCKVLRPNSKVHPGYFANFFKTRDYRRRISALAAGVNINNLRNEHLDELEIPLPPLEEQRRIAEVLDRAEELRSKRREAIALLDTLTQAIFLEMFGAPNSNHQNYLKLPLSELCAIDSPLVDPTLPEYENLFHIGPDRIERNTGKLLPAKTAKQDGLTSVKFRFKSDCILYSKIRPYLNKVALATESGLCSADMYPVTVRSEIAVREFIWYLLLSDDFLKYAATLSNRSNIPKINRKQFLAYPAICPPLKLQKQFANRVTAIENLKTAHRASLSELDALFASLQHRAFRGEL